MTDVTTQRGPLPPDNTTVRVLDKASRPPTIQPQLITLGFDLKITPSGHVAIIEVNGINSGMEGYKRLHGEIEESKRWVSRVDGSSTPIDDILFEKDGTEVRHLNAQDIVRGSNYSIDAGKYNGHSRSLMERMSCWWKNAGTEVRGALILRIASHFDEWRKGDARAECALLAAESRIPGDLPPSFRALEMLRILWGVSRVGIDPQLGLIIESQEPPQGERKELLQGFLRQVYQDFPVDPQVIAVDPSYYDGSLWCHPHHWIINAKEVIKVSDDKAILCNFTSVVTNSRELVAITSDKIAQKEFLPKEFQAPFIVWQGYWEPVQQFLTDLIQGEIKSPLIDLDKFPFIVVKRNSGSHGDGVNIIDISKTEELESLLRNIPAGSALVEAFVPSQKIQNPANNGKFHDGCMRYLIDVRIEEGESGMISTTLFNACYWRLSPANLEDAALSPNSALKANLTGKQPAIPQKASVADIELANGAVEVALRRLLLHRELFQNPSKKPMCDG
jgi:hypothetical protein